MSIIVTNIRTGYSACDMDIIDSALKKLGVSQGDVAFGGIYRESLDLRHGRISKICSVELELYDNSLEEALALKDQSIYKKPSASMPECMGREKLSDPPVVVGFGPAGMFAALVLAERGLKPIVLERGGCIEQRDGDVDGFFKNIKLNLNSNIQFGEGGAGAYSDGKLTTRINDPLCLLVLDLLRKHGAPEKVLRLAKPHIGTDLLKGIVVSIRKRIEALGGRVCFNTRVDGISTHNGRLVSLETSAGSVDTQIAVFAIGHSARDTVEMLYKKGLIIEPKAFSVGFRIEHLRSWVDESVYGKGCENKELPSAEYTLSAKPFDRGCYSFCMCPGGYVIAAASEENSVVTNGMSYHDRSGKNSNSALCVSVFPSDFPSDSPLAGIEFQRDLEKKAFIAGGSNYSVPVQTVGDFINGRRSKEIKSVMPTYPIGYELTDFSSWMPNFVTNSVKASMPVFSRKLSCFGREDAILSGIESRTSSPVRIIRNEQYFSPVAEGVIPCGEGAGYAGGIMSAAVDGVKAAAAILEKYTY